MGLRALAAERRQHCALQPCTPMGTVFLLTLLWGCALAGPTSRGSGGLPPRRGHQHHALRGPLSQHGALPPFDSGACNIASSSVSSLCGEGCWSTLRLHVPQQEGLACAFPGEARGGAYFCLISRAVPSLVFRMFTIPFCLPFTVQAVAQINQPEARSPGPGCERVLLRALCSRSCPCSQEFAGSPWSWACTHAPSTLSPSSHGLLCASTCLSSHKDTSR